MTLQFKPTLLLKNQEDLERKGPRRVRGNLNKAMSIELSQCRERVSAVSAGKWAIRGPNQALSYS